MKEKSPAFLAVVWGQEHRKVNTAVKTESIGPTEGKKRDLMKQQGPKKRFLSVEKRKAEILLRVGPGVCAKLEGLVDEFKDVFPDTFPKGRPPKRDIVHEIRTEEGARHPNFFLGIDSLLERLGQAEVSMKLDLASEYRQIAMEETSI